MKNVVVMIVFVAISISFSYCAMSDNGGVQRNVFWLDDGFPPSPRLWRTSDASTTCTDIGLDWVTTTT